MKEELIKIFNNKLGDINQNIDSLEELNTKINEENDKLSFVDRIIGLFKEEDQNNFMNFVKVDKDEFDSVLEIVGEDVKKIFNSESCNYDGLVYLINGINSGVSITLTDEQKNSIETLIKSMEDKKNEMVSTVDGYEETKSHFDVSDVNELSEKKHQYNKVINNLEKGKYIRDIDLLKEAIAFSKLSPEDTINVLGYVLEYNADVHRGNKSEDEEPKEEVKEEEVKEEAKEQEEQPAPEPEEIEEVQEEKEVEEVKEEPKEEEFHFRQVENENLFDLPNITFDDEPTAMNNENNDATDIVEPVAEEPKEEEVKEEAKEQEEQPTPEPQEDEMPTYVPVTDESMMPQVEEPKEEIPAEEVQLPASVPEEVAPVEPVVLEAEPPKEETPVEPAPTEPVSVPEEVAPVEEVPAAPVAEEIKEEPEAIDNDFKDVVDVKDYETREKQEEEKTSTRELHKIFGKYGIEENVILNELIDGNVTEYQHTLDSLKEHGILDYFKKNKELLVETLLYSNVNVIDKVLKIVKEDLSVDEEDYGITLKIVINTIPSIFIKEGGNYDNFIQNVELFKNLEINLINLFDFSKEIFVADNEHIQHNLDIVNKYDFDINYKNAKYFLLIPNIAEKLDYYIESVYEDKTKKQIFDGVNYIKEFAPKLNVVTDETIKRLRYASSTGSKVFGNKPGSLSGEITNLKVNALAISDEYMKSFFNNEFTTLTSDEVREYVKLVRNSSNVGDYSDELDKLNPYRNGLRYTIEGVNVSYNKVVRNYDVLRSYGIDTKKALQFAVCYNLVITKDEYNKVSELLNKIGGNA